MQCAVYDLGCCSSPTASLKTSRLGGTTTLPGSAFQLDNSQCKEGVFVVILASMNLTACHRVAKYGNPMCGLYVVGKGHSHEAVYNFVEETETGHKSSLFKGLPVQLRQQ